MRLFTAIVFVCAVGFSLGTASDQEVFVEVPSSITVVIGSNATFNCAVRAHSLAWYVDDQTRQHFMDRNISFVSNPPNDIIQSTLTIIATKMNNESKVECEAYIFGSNGGTLTKSNSTFLKIQGLLEASGNFMVQHQSNVNNTVQLSWIPPYTFPEVPITHFHLSWFNLMTGLNGTVLLTLSTVNNSETGRFLYDFSTDDISPCHVYVFQLRAQNGGGLGAATDSVQGYFLSGPLMIQRKTVSTKIEFTSSADEVSVTFQFPTDACLGRVADNFTIYIYNIHGTGCTHSNLKGDVVHIGPRLEVTEIGFRDSTQVLPLNLHYNAVIEARNSIGSSNSTEIIQISTFDIQDGKIEEISPGSLKITCIFAVGSEAEGCCAMLQDSELGTTVITILRNSTQLLEATSVVAINEGDTYSIYIYDLEKNETFCDFSNPAVVGIVYNTSTSVSTKITVIISSTVGFAGVLFSVLIITVSIIHCRRAVVYCLKERNKESNKSLDPGPLYEEITMASAEGSPVVTLNISYAESIRTKPNVCYENHTVSVGVNRV